MSIVEPLPAGYGKADWVDYSNYWREADAEWIQDRIVLRVNNDAGRDALAQGVGGVVYNATKDQLELKRAGGYATLTPLPTTLTTAEVAGPPQKTTISHTGAGGQGLVFSATEIGITDELNVLNGVFTVAATGITMKTGSKTARWTTDATQLLSDTPLSAPAVVLTGTGIVLAAPGKTAQVGTLTAEIVNANSGSVVGAWNAGSGTIGGVAHSGGRVTAGESGGIVTGKGIFYGDSNSAVMRYWSGSAMGGPYLQVTSGGQVVSGGGYFDVYSQMRVFGGQGIHYYDNIGRHMAYVSPSFYSAGDPGAQYFPDGSIWIS